MSVHTNCVVLSYDNDKLANVLKVNKGKPLDFILYETNLSSFLEGDRFRNEMKEEFNLSDYEFEQVKMNRVWIEDILEPDPSDEENIIFNYSKLPDGDGNLKEPKILFEIYYKMFNVIHGKFFEGLKADQNLIKSIENRRSGLNANLELLMFIKEILGILELLEVEDKKVKIFFCEY